MADDPTNEPEFKNHKSFIESCLKQLRTPFVIEPKDCPYDIPPAVAKAVINKMNEQIKRDAAEQWPQSSIQDTALKLHYQSTALKKRKEKLNENLTETVSRLPEVWDGAEEQGELAARYQELKREVFALERAIASAKSHRDHYQQLVDELSAIDVSALANVTFGTRSPLERELEEQNLLMFQLLQRAKDNPDFLRWLKRRALAKAEAQRAEDDLATDAALLFEQKKHEEQEAQMQEQERLERQQEEEKGLKEKQLRSSEARAKRLKSQK